MKRLFLLLALVCLPGIARAQIVGGAGGFNGGNIGSNSSPVISSIGQPIPGVNIAICQPMLTSTAVVSNNLATLTMTGNPLSSGYLVGKTLVVTGFSGADVYFNGSFTIASVSPTTISYSLVAANATATTVGSALQQGDSTTPCAALAPIFSDPALTIPLTQPIFSDGVGNWNAFAQPGVYDVQFYGPNTATTVKQYSIACVPGSAVGACGAISLGGANNFTGPINCTVINSVFCISIGNPQNWPGGDIGAWINAAYLAAPANGCEIQIAAGTYTWTTPIVFGTANKPCIVEGVGYATWLNFTPTSGTAITENYGPGVGTTHPRGQGFRDIRLSGPATGTTIGLLLGGTNGAEGFYCDHCYITGFDQDVLYGNNTWGTDFENSVIRNSSTHLLSMPGPSSNSGEAPTFHQTAFLQDDPTLPFAGAISLADVNADPNFSDSSIDNAQVSISGSLVQMSNITMFNFAAQSVPWISMACGTLHISGIQIFNSFPLTTSPSVISSSCGFMDVSGFRMGSVTYVFPAFFALANGAILRASGNFAFGSYTNLVSTSTFTGYYLAEESSSTSGFFSLGSSTPDADIQIKNLGGGQSWALDSLSTGNFALFPKTDATKFVDLSAGGGVISNVFKGANANPALTGVLRLPSANAIGWRNNANMADVSLGTNSNDALVWTGTALNAAGYQTTTNCAGVGTAASPSIASCSSAAAGHFSCDTAATGATCQVNTTAVTANSEIFVFESDTSATGTALGVTCNSSTAVSPTSRLLASSVAATSFTINLGTVTTHPACFSYFIVN